MRSLGKNRNVNEIIFLVNVPNTDLKLHPHHQLHKPPLQIHIQIATKNQTQS